MVNSNGNNIGTIFNTTSDNKATYSGVYKLDIPNVTVSIVIYLGPNADLGSRLRVDKIWLE